MPRSSAVARACLRLVGWRVRFEGLPPGCGVVILYPHTSNWDFVFLMLAKWAMGVPAIFLGKDSLFRVPLLSACMRFWGGLPVDRARPHGLIADMALKLREAGARGEQTWLALAPEGTRKYESHWRSGFYHIAVQAGVPLGLAYLNFARREVGLTEFLSLTGEEAADLPRIAAYYAGHAYGKHPDQAAPVRLAP